MSDDEGGHDDIIQQNEEIEEQEQDEISKAEPVERNLEPSEPGYDLVRDGFGEKYHILEFQGPAGPEILAPAGCFLASLESMFASLTFFIIILIIRKCLSPMCKKMFAPPPPITKKCSSPPPSCV